MCSKGLLIEVLVAVRSLTSSLRRPLPRTSLIASSFPFTSSFHRLVLKTSPSLFLEFSENSDQNIDSMVDGEPTIDEVAVLLPEDKIQVCVR